MRTIILFIALGAFACGSKTTTSNLTQSTDLEETRGITFPWTVDRGAVYRSDNCSPGSIHRVISENTDCGGWGVGVDKSHSIRIGRNCINVPNQTNLLQACLEVRAGLRTRGRALFDVIYTGNNCDVSTLRRIIKYDSTSTKDCGGWGVGVDKAGSIKINGVCRNVGNETTIQQACLEILSWH